MKYWLALTLSLASIASTAEPEPPESTRFLVVAPDRGFHGNETVETRFDEYRRDYPGARLFFMTSRRQAERLDAELRRTVVGDPTRLVVLPLVLSEQEHEFQRFLSDLEAARSRLSTPLTVEIRPAFGRSVAAAHILDDYLRAARKESLVEPSRVFVLGSRASDDESERHIRAVLDDLVATVPSSGDATAVEVLFSGRNDDARARNAGVYQRISLEPNPLVIPFFLDFRADGHMAVEAGVARSLGAKAQGLYGKMLDEHPALSDWMRRESASALPPTQESLGVVVLAHGSDRVWNDELREALAPLSQSYDVEISFNMADPDLVEKAVHTLEARGRRHIVIYRLFGLESSFQETVESMIAPTISRGAGHGYAAHAGHGANRLPIPSSAYLTTFGGIEDNALFAEALLARAEAASDGERSREVVLLVAHGAGEDTDDQHWRALLASLAEQMQQRATPPFYEIAGATLREDWPDKREQALKEITELVERHRAAGRRVLAVEARLNGPGPTHELLDALSLKVDDEGFVPHPNVSRLVKGDIATYLTSSAPAPAEGRRPVPRARRE